ncbi:MAG: chromate transporter [Peptococcaceae bacterium]|jgi:chromate transporter|nr:chromate transporter [Peptococcaceae bacterium]
MSIYPDLFLTFFRVGSLTFGGGYAMLPLIQKEVVEKKRWATTEDIVDYYAVGQCLPGMIAVNTAVLIGYQVGKKRGAAAAAAGLVSPSLIVILAIAALIQNFADLPAVQSAFAGIRVAVCALIVNAVWKIARQGIKDLPALLLGLGALGAAFWLKVSPVPLVILAGLFGLALRGRRGAPESPESPEPSEPPEPPEPPAHRLKGQGAGPK